ncbi:MAG: septum formation initiator family protein [Patescibacteria group bacterium]
MGRRTSKGKKTKIMVLALGMIASFLVYKVGRVSYEKYQITRQISTIDGELKALSAKSDDLQTLIKHLNDDTYVEKEARKKLNLQKEGEKAVIIVGGPNATIKKKESAQSTTESQESNPQKWFRVLFGK